MTPRQYVVLWQLPDDRWVTPLEVGGSDASWHSPVLQQCVHAGWVERKRRAGWVRHSYFYRRTSAGKQAFEAARLTFGSPYDVTT